jgi:hypothetical protein
MCSTRYVEFLRCLSLGSEILDQSAMDAMKQLISRTFFVLPNRASFLTYAMEEYNKGRTVAYNGYYRCICILLPQLEHALRYQKF